MQMNKRVLLMAATAVLVCLLVQPLSAADEPSLEYKVKAAFLYNFLKFVEWPEDENPDINKPIVIGIVGEDKFGAAFNEITSRKVKDRNIIIRKFSDAASDETKNGLPECHLVFMASSQKSHTKEIAASLNKKPVLLVGESDGFLEAGGSVNFIMQDNKVCFEINADNADAANLKIAAQLLRLAKKVIKDGAVKSSYATDLWFRQTRGA